MNSVIALALLFGAAPAKEVPSPASAIQAAHIDLWRIREADAKAELATKDSGFKYVPAAPYQRYLKLTSRGKHYEDFLLVLKGHLHMLSREKAHFQPVLIDPWVVRIDIRWLGWHKSGVALTWEKLAKFDFMFHGDVEVKEDHTFDQAWPGGTDSKGKHYDRKVWDVDKKKGSTFRRMDEMPWLHTVSEQCKDLRHWSYSEAPIVWAEWFFVQSARQFSLNNKLNGIGYYDFLGLKTRDDCLKLAGVNEQAVKDAQAEWRALVKRSKISRQGRFVGALGGASGKAHFTLDFFDQGGKNVPERNLEKGAIVHDAEEWFFVLPNGFPFTALVDNKGANGAKAGDLVASAPDQIGPDSSALTAKQNKQRDEGMDTRVHTNISCIACHCGDKDLLKPISDWYKRSFKRGGSYDLYEYDEEKRQQLKNLYLSDLPEVIDETRAVYVRSIRRCTASATYPKGLATAQFGKLYVEAFQRYAYDPVMLEDAAWEIGASPARYKQVLMALMAQNRLDPAALDFLPGTDDDGNVVPPDGLVRTTWETTWQYAAVVSMGVKPPDTLKKVPLKKEFNK